MKSHIWLRSETKDHERRTPLTPIGAQQLIQDGHIVTVEKCNDRIIKDSDYQNVGCQLVDALSWKTAPKETIILGLKELPENESDPLIHKHIFFGHAFKGQAGATELLKRFKSGGGSLYDLEYLIDENQRRVAAFGFWADLLVQRPLWIPGQIYLKGKISHLFTTMNTKMNGLPPSKND